MQYHSFKTEEPTSLSEFSEEIEFSLINNWNICPIVEHLKIY